MSGGLRGKGLLECQKNGWARYCASHASTKGRNRGSHRRRSRRAPLYWNSDLGTSHNSDMKMTDHRFCVAPMMDWTDRHCRHFHRQLTRNARLYTEMVSAQALMHGDVSQLLRFHIQEHPVALQIGGWEAGTMTHAARVGEDYGYDEININCGCPSSRVTEARFGACLMNEPRQVADLVTAMKGAVQIPITVKCRVGLDHDEEEDCLHRFVETVASAGCQTFIVHARNAWLSGLSPKENREIPPLRYNAVTKLKRAYPGLQIVLNGGIKSLSACQKVLSELDGVMIGRAAYEDPWLLSRVDSILFKQKDPVRTREEAINSMYAYIASELAADTPLAHIVRPLLGIYRGEPGGRAFRRILSTDGRAPKAGLEALEAAVREARGRIHAAA